MIRSWRLLLLCLALFWVPGCGRNDGAEPTGSAGLKPEAEWRTLEPALSRRTEVAAASTQYDIYVSGGFAEDRSTVPTVEIYNVQRDEFRKGPDLPVAVNHAMSAAINSGRSMGPPEGSVYVLGGYLSGLSSPSDRAFVLEEGTEEPRWQELPRMPEPRAAAGAAAVNGKIYVAGGVGPNGLADSTLVYDPEAKAWTKAPGLPTPREHLGVAGFMNRLFVVGGRAPTNLGAAEVFDVDRKSWTKLPDMPTPRGGLAAAAVGRFIVAPGGEQASGTYKQVEAFDSETGKWISLPDLPTPRHGLGVAVIGAGVYVIAGGPEPGFAFSNANEMLSLQRA